MLIVETKYNCKTISSTFKKKLTLKKRDKRFEIALKKNYKLIANCNKYLEFRQQLIRRR